MYDLSFSPNDVSISKLLGKPYVGSLLASEAITAGQTVRKSTSTTCALSGATLGLDDCIGIAVCSAGIGQPCHFLNNEDLTFASPILETGKTYALADTLGGITLLENLTANSQVTLLGVAKSTTVLAVRVHVSTGITDMARDFYAEVAKGQVAGHSLVQIVGRNNDVAQGAWEIIGLLGASALPLSAATTVRIKAGGSADDAAAGSGAREVTVQGIDDAFAEVTEAIATAGASASAATSASFWRVYRAWVSSVGTYGEDNAGDIVIEDSGGTTDVLKIAEGEAEAAGCAWTCPVAKTAYLLGLHVQVDAGKRADVRLRTREDIDDTSAPMKPSRQRLFFEGVSGAMDYEADGSKLEIVAKSDIWIEAAGVDATAEVSATMDILLVDD